MEVQAMQKVFVMYRLKPGVKIEDYRKWSISLDQKVTPFHALFFQILGNALKFWYHKFLFLDWDWGKFPVVEN